MTAHPTQDEDSWAETDWVAAPSHRRTQDVVSLVLVLACAIGLVAVAFSVDVKLGMAAVLTVGLAVGVTLGLDGRGG